VEPRVIQVTYENEYQWIESAIHGAAVGTYEICGVGVRVETELSSRFSGSSLISW
jgi:hypothetical protein